MPLGNILGPLHFLLYVHDPISFTLNTAFVLFMPIMLFINNFIEREDESLIHSKLSCDFNVLCNMLQQTSKLMSYKNNCFYICSVRRFVHIQGFVKKLNHQKNRCLQQQSAFHHVFLKSYCFTVWSLTTTEFTELQRLYFFGK